MAIMLNVKKLSLSYGLIILVFASLIGVALWFCANPFYKLRNGMEINVPPIDNRESLYYYYASIAMSRYGLNIAEMTPIQVRYLSVQKARRNFDWESTFSEERNGLGAIRVQIKLGDPVIVRLQSLP